MLVLVLVLVLHTSFWSRRCDLVEGRLLEWPPFEILLVSPTWNTSLVTLLTCRLRLVTF
jgi:hypothetical protein